MFRRILVPIDGSPTSNLGLREAIKLAKDQSGTLYLLHVVDEMAVTRGFDGTMFVTARYINELLDAMRDKGKKILARAEKEAKKHAIECQTLLCETVVMQSPR